MRTPRQIPLAAGAPRRAWQALAWLTCLGASACADTGESLAQAPAAEGERKVVGGQPSGICGWPSTVLVEGGCTGTLIHPRVVTTAAHCLTSSQAQIDFGEQGEPGGFSVMGECTAGANGSEGAITGADWAYCVLPEDPRIDQVPFTPPLVGCEAERFLKPGNRGWIVGYGTTGRGWFARGGEKREVEVPINQLDKMGPGTIDVGDANIGACHGDSGGPIYMELVDGDKSYGFRVFGSTSGPGSDFCDCSCSTTYVNIAQHVRAIEENEGIDVTPCTADDGSWDPGPDCTEMLKNPREGSGEWPGCEVERTTDPIATCGAPYEPDAGAAPTDASTPDGGAPTTGGDGGTPGAADPTGGTGIGADGAQPTDGVGTTGNPWTPPESGSTGGTGVALGPSTGTTGMTPTGFAAPDAGIPQAASGTNAGYPFQDPAYTAPSSGGCSVAGDSSNRATLTFLLALMLGLLARRRSARGPSSRTESGSRETVTRFS